MIIRLFPLSDTEHSVVPLPMSSWHTESYSSGKFAGKDSTTTSLTLICTLSVPADVLFHPNEIELAPSNVAQRDTENYLNETENDLDETIIKLVLPVSIVMSTVLFSEPFSAVTEIPDTAVTTGLLSP